MKRFLLCLAACLALAPTAAAQLGVLPYHYKITGRTGTGVPTDAYIVSFEIHDANHVLKGTQSFHYSSGTTADEIKTGITREVKARAASDAGSTAALIAAMIGRDEDMDSPPIDLSMPDATTTVKGKSMLAVDNEATATKSMKSDDPRGSNDRRANNLATATTTVGISAAAAPITGQVLKATGPTAATWQTDATGSGSGPTFARVTADVANSTITFANVTGLTFAVSAATSYAFSCELSYTTAVSTTALQLSINGPAAPTAMRYAVRTSTTATALHSASQAAYDTNTNPATGGGATALPVRIAGVLQNGANAGTLAIRSRSEIAASAATVQRGSFCSFTVIP